MSDSEIEFIDAGDAAPIGPVNETAQPRLDPDSPPARSGWGVPSGAMIIAALVATIGIATLVRGGAQETTEQSPATTNPQQPPDASSVDSTLPPLPVRANGAVVGDGPTLEWHVVSSDTAAPEFRWIDAGFLASERDHDIVIRPTQTGADVTIQTSAVAPGRAIVTGRSAVVTFDGPNPSQLVFYARGGSRTIDLDPLLAPASDLITTEFAIDVEVNGSRALILQSATGVLNADEFRSRTGIELTTIYGVGLTSTLLTAFGEDGESSVELADLELTDADEAALRSIQNPIQVLTVADFASGTGEPGDADVGQIDWLASVGNEFLVQGNELARSVDGLLWERTDPTTPRFGVAEPSPDGTLVAADYPGEDPVVVRSTDAARQWEQTPAPIRNPWSLVGVADIAATTGWQAFDFGSTASAWSVLTNDFELAVNASEQRFELLTRDGLLVLAGLFGDPESGFRNTAGSNDIWFVDPETGDEIARFTQMQIAASFAAGRTLAGDPQLVAMTDWAPGGRDPEWSLTPVTDVFGADALAVSFVAGDGWLLADVTTRSGRELFLAKIPDSRRDREG